MKKLLLILVFACLAWSGSAQRLPAGSTAAAGGGGTPTPPGRWKEHQDSVFQYIDRTPVGTGLLTDYGFALLNYRNYNGVALHDNNYADIGAWRLLYAAMHTSIFNANATLLPLPAANFRLRQVRSQLGADVVPLATLLARYERFRDDAGTAGLITVNNGQLHDAPNRPTSPYEQPAA